MRDLFKVVAIFCFFAAAAAYCGVADALQNLKVPRRARGKASWYGGEHRGKKMANGERFDPEARTCATRDWPLGSVLRVRCVATRRFVFVTVTDRGPAVWTGCIIDLSSRAFAMIASRDLGHIDVEIELMPEPDEEPLGYRVGMPA